MFGGGRDRDSNGPPIWLIVMIVSIVTYALSYVLIAGRPRRVTPSAGPG
jgi:heat shock protein HtpX